MERIFGRRQNIKNAISNWPSDPERVMRGKVAARKFRFVPGGRNTYRNFRLCALPSRSPRRFSLPGVPTSLEIGTPRTVSDWQTADKHCLGGRYTPRKRFEAVTYVFAEDRNIHYLHKGFTKPADFVPVPLSDTSRFP